MKLKRLIFLSLLSTATLLPAFFCATPTQKNIEANEKINSPFQEKFILTSSVSNEISLDETTAATFDLSGISSISSVRAYFVGENKNNVNIYIDWSQYQPWDPYNPSTPGKNGKICWKLNDSKIQNIHGNIVVYYAAPGQSKKVIFDSGELSISAKKTENYSLEILNTKSEYNSIKSAAVFCFDDTVEKAEDFKFYLQNEFGNNLENWKPTTEIQNNKILISLECNVSRREDETILLKGKIVAKKIINSKEETVKTSELKNFELRKICFLEIKNTTGKINNELEDFAILKINNKYSGETFAAKIFEKNGSEAKDWNVKIKSGISGRQISLTPPSSSLEIRKELTVKIYLDSKVVEESKLIEVSFKNELNTIDKENVSFTLVDNLFWIENNINETFDIGKIVVGVNCQIQNLEFQVINADTNSIDDNLVVMVEKSDAPNQFTCFLKYHSVDKINPETNYKIHILDNQKLVRETSIFAIRKIENTTTKFLEKNMVYNVWNNEISEENNGIVKFKKAFSVYTTSIWSSQDRPWENFDYKFVNRNNQKVNFEKLDFQKIIRSNKCIGWYIDASFKTAIEPTEIKIEIIQNDTIIQNGEYALLSEKNKYLNPKEFCIPRIGKTLSFLEFEIPDLDPDFDDVRVELVDQHGQKNSNYKVNINSSGEETWCSIELAKKEVSQNFIGRVNVYADDELICQTNNQQITVHEINGTFTKWEGDSFSFSNRKFDGKISFIGKNYDVTKCDFDLVDKYGKSYLAEKWIMSQQKVDGENKMDFYISAPSQFMEDSFQEMKLVTFAYGKTICESELFSVEVIHPNLSFNNAWSEQSQQYSYKGGIEDITSIKLNNVFFLYKNVDFGKNLLDIAEDITVAINDNVKVTLNKENSENNILSFDIEYLFKDFAKFLKKIPNPVENINSSVHKNYFYEFSQKIEIAPKVYYKNSTKIFEMGSTTIKLSGVLKQAMSYDTADPIASYFWDIYKIDSIILN